MRPKRHTGKTIPLATAGVLFACLVFAQTDDASENEDAAEAPDGDSMDEIVVIAPPAGRKGMETPYEEQLRQRILEEYDRMAREQEELAWRQEPALEDPSRISFGYRPQDRRRDDTRDRINTLPLDKVKPATVFRFEF